MKLTDIAETTKFNIALVACLAIYFTHFAFILRYAVNIPFWDEWEAVAPDGIVANPSLSELFAQHNEHRIVTTKLLTLLLYKLDGWNIITNLALNFIIYGLMIFLVVRIIEICVPNLPSWILLCFAIFLFTGLGWENHFWAFQTTFHFSLLFLLISIYYLFNQQQNWKNTLSGVFFAWLTIYSIASGLVEIVVAALVYTCFKLLRLRQNDDAPDGRKQLERNQLIAALILIGAAVGLYFVGYVKPPLHPPLVLPYKREFWLYFLNLLSGGFGYQSIKLLPGFIVLFFAVVPLIGELLKRRLRLTAGGWIIATLILSIIGALCSITMGRAGFDSIALSKSSRYAEIVGLLIPLSVAMWAIFLGEKQKLRNAVLLTYWLFCAISFAKYWDIPKHYHAVAQERQKGAQCVNDYYHKGGDGNCPTIYPVPIADKLNFDKTMKLSFVYENTPK